MSAHEQVPEQTQGEIDLEVRGYMEYLRRKDEEKNDTTRVLNKLESRFSDNGDWDSLECVLQLKQTLSLFIYRRRPKL
jgi:hypothetical protein